MCLSLTPTGVCHAVDVVPCPHLPASLPYVLLPLPGAPPYRCPHPCARPCRFVSTLPAPPAPPTRLLTSLRLVATHRHLVAAVLAETEPAGTSADVRGPKAYGCLRYYRN